MPVSLVSGRISGDKMKTNITVERKVNTMEIIKFRTIRRFRRRRISGHNRHGCYFLKISCQYMCILHVLEMYLS
jgi:hypothetical protein